MLDLESILNELYSIIMDRIEKMPPNSYTAQLVSRGLEYIARKFGEEAVEVIVASIAESKDRLISEIADLIYHLLVLMAIRGITIDDIVKELNRRRR